ncbi:MAG: DNA repair protein RecO [Eubacterium sp.]|nr:DNA repair protein RecO [Eubacterium sp.]
MQEKVTGMVLSGTPVGENDKRIVILTKERGKISAFARGARRAKSPLLAACEPFTFGEFSVYRGRDSYTVSSVEVKNYFSELREELEDIYMGMYFCEVADYFTRENLDAREVLKLLYQSLRALKVPSLNRVLVKTIFEFKMIAVNGEAPRLFACIGCGKKEELFYFHNQQAGILCENCYEKAPYGGKGAVKIMGTTTYILQRIFATPVEKLYTFSVKEPVQKELEQVVKRYFSTRVDRRFNTTEFIDKFWYNEN